jgi:hypothetical protein
MTARSDDWRFDELHADRAQELLYQILISKQPVRGETPAPPHLPGVLPEDGNLPAKKKKKILFFAYNPPSIHI